MPELKQTVYKDIPLSFIAHPITGNIKALENREAVKQSVKNIVLTNFYERPYKPFFGGDILSQLFENVDSMVEYNLAKNIRVSLENYEPRAIIDDIIIDEDQDNNTLNATIIFRLKNDINPVSLSVLLERVR
jgi:phage baseplate assembly protein W